MYENDRSRKEPGRLKKKKNILPIMIDIAPGPINALVCKFFFLLLIYCSFSVDTHLFVPCVYTTPTVIFITSNLRQIYYIYSNIYYVKFVTSSSQ